MFVYHVRSVLMEDSQSVSEVHLGPICRGASLLPENGPCTNFVYARAKFKKANINPASVALFIDRILNEAGLSKEIAHVVVEK